VEKHLKALYNLGQFDDNQSINQRMNSHQFNQANNQVAINSLLGTLEKPCLAAR